MNKKVTYAVLVLVLLVMIPMIGPAALLLPCLLGMAKVEGPLFSLEARGKIGNVMVHFPWKGRNVVRKWLKPTNPRDIDKNSQQLVDVSEKSWEWQPQPLTARTPFRSGKH